MQQCVFELTGVAKRYGSVEALKPLTARVAAGQTCAFIGPSGSGKSTLIKLLAGLIRPSAGRVLFHGEDVQGLDPVSYRRRLGYVIQDGGLFPHLTARANVVLVAREAGWSAEAMDARVAELADLVHLPLAALDRYPIALSGGQRQRVGIMRALMLDPEVLLFDEPFSALDPIIRHDLQQEVRDIMCGLHKSAVLITHDMDEARFLAHDLYLMRNGALIQHGRFEDLANTPADPFVTRFLAASRPMDAPSAEPAGAQVPPHAAPPGAEARP
ncbi:hypothetical protein CCR85_01420 [Rhodothalassium salexigens]|nr:hypothetical protein [Rhodothalassium salexigens]